MLKKTSLILILIALLCIVACFPKPAKSQTDSSLDNAGVTFKNIFPRHCESLLFLDSAGTTMLISTRNQIYKSTDGGITWEMFVEFPYPIVIKQMMLADTAQSGILVNGVGDLGGLFFLEDNGKKISKVLNSYGRGITICKPAESGDMFTVSQMPAAFYISTDRGKTWKKRGVIDESVEALTFESHICSLASIQTGKVLRFIVSSSNPAGLYISDDTGKTWTAPAERLLTTSVEAPLVINGLSHHELYAILCTNTSVSPRKSLLASEDNGNTWSAMPSPGSLWSIAVEPEISRVFISQFNTYDEDFPQSAVFVSDGVGKKWRPFGNNNSMNIWTISITSDHSKIGIVSEKGAFLAKLK